MEEQGNKDMNREEIYSRVIRAGKRTYFFDVKATRAGEQYLTITESKRRFNNEQGKFYYEKHKLFLYKEDFEKYARGLSEVIEFIETGKKAVEPEAEAVVEKKEEKKVINPESVTNIEFEDLGDPEESKEEDV